MNRLSTLSLITVLSLFGFSSRAQVPFPTIDSININNITASVLVHGDMWWNPTAPYEPNHVYNSSCYVYHNAGFGINFASVIWMSGYDAANTLHVAAQTYRQDGNDYWPGPIDATTGSLSYATSQKWAKIWKVDRATVDSFRTVSSPTIANTPASILTWPGKGNTFAQGNAGVSLSITTDMAPFVDLNANGIYEPLMGEYPDFTGEQALWWVFSDSGPTHNNTNGTPLGVEVHVMAYGYHRNTAIDNVVYYDYTIVNKSANNYHDFRYALWDDITPEYYDYFIGFDSVHRMGIYYKADNDNGASGGHPTHSFSTLPPIVGVTMIVLPGDAGSNYTPAGSFDYYNNDASIIGNPANDTEYNNYMHAKLRNGQHFTNDYTGTDSPSHGYGSGPDCNYVFSGDPSNTTQWSECASNNNPGDYRFILSSNDFNLNAGSSQHLVMALVVTDTTESSCPNTSFTKIKAIADTAWNTYYNPLAPLKSSNGNNNSNTTAAGSITTYPNPAHDVLTIKDEYNNINAASITVYNDVGKVVYVQMTRNGQLCQLDISRLTHGLYNVVYYNGRTQASKRFMKE